MQRRYHRPVLECLEDRLTPSTTLYSNHYTDVVVDNARQLLYLPTESGTVERYDLAQKQFLAPWTVGYSLSQGDITPDGKYLVVGDRNPFGRFGVVDQIDLATGQVTNLTYSLSIYHSDPIHELVMTSATHGYLTTGGFRTNDTGELREIDLTSGKVTLDPTQPYTSGISSLRRSEDYQTVYLTWMTSLTRIDIATQQRFTIPVLRYENNNALALNHDGTMMAYAPTYGGLSIFDAQGKAIKTLNTHANGLYFDPARSRLYLGNNETGELEAYNTTTWQQELAIPLLFSDAQPTLSEAMTTQGDYYFRLTSDFLFIQEIPTGIGALHHFDVSVSSTLAPAGTPLTVTVTARDIYGQVKTDYQGSVSFASDSLQAQLPGGYTFQPSDAGQHQFVVTCPVPGNYNLKVRDDNDPGKRGVQEGIVAHSGHATFLAVPDLADTAFDPASQLLYLASQNGLLYRFDLTTQTMLAPWNMGIYPGGMDVSLDGRYLFVTDVLQNMVQADVLRIDLTNGQIQTIWYDMRQPVYWYASSTDIATMHDGTALLVGAGGALYHLDHANHITLEPWSFGDTEYTRVEPTYDRKQALLERFGFESIYHEDTGRIDRIGGVVPLSQVTNLAGTLLPVKSFDGGFNIAAIDLHENPVVNHVEAGSPGAFDPLLNWFYVNQNDDGWVVAYDLATGEAVQATPLQDYYDPFGADLVSRISPDRRWYLVPNRLGVRLADWQQAITAQLSVADTQVLEGTGGSTSVQLHVRLSEPVAQEVTVQYETQGNTAGGYSDYTTISGTLHFVPGELEKNVTISINPDDIYEQDQQFSLVLSKPVNAFVGAHQRGWITILDDDAVPFVEFQSTVSSSLEGEPLHSIALVLIGRTEVPVTVQVIRTGGTASDDDTIVYSHLNDITVDNDNGGMIQLFNFDDIDFEPDETVQFQIVEASNAILGSKLTHVYTILNDDPVSVQWQLTRMSMSEAVTRPMIQVTLAQAMPTPVSVGVSVSTGFEAGSVSINASDTMNASNDYRLLSNRIYFAPGQKTAYLPLRIINDSIYEYDQELRFFLTDPTGGIGIGSRNELDYFILNDDKPPLVSFARDWSIVREQNGSARIGELRLSVPSEVPLGVLVESHSLTARQGYDYDLSNYYSFSPGQVSIPLDVMLYDDTIYEPTQVVSLGIASYYTDARIGGRHAMSLLIQDNDPRPVARFQSSILIAQPGQELVPVLVELDRAANVPIYVSLQVKPGSTARYGVDYRWESLRTAVVEPGQTEVTFWIRLLHPGQAKSNRALNLELISPAPATFKSGNTLSILIRDGN